MKVAIEFSENQRFRTVVEIDDDEFEAWSAIQTWPKDQRGRDYRVKRFIVRQQMPYHLSGNVDHLAVRREILAVAVV